MSLFHIGVAVGLLLTAGVGLVHVFRQPGRADSLLAVLLMGSTGVALVLVLGIGLGVGRAADIGLVSAMLASVLGVAFVLRGWQDDQSGGGPEA